MAYTSYFYLIVFLGLTLLFYTVIPKQFRWTVLLVASYIYYFLSSPKTLIFLLITTISIYLCGVWLDKLSDTMEQAKKYLPKENKKTFKQTIIWQKKAVVVLMILVNFGLLLFLKYYNFTAGSLNSLFQAISLKPPAPALKLLLPLGISFYTLQAASYIIDVYRGKYRADHHLGRVALFLCFFPQIVEGPIGRYDLLGHQLYEGHSFEYKRVAFGVQLIVWGLFKKLVIADRINIFVKNVFEKYTEQGGIVVIAAVLMYTIQIYAEFSGCMDIVTGSAQLFGVNLSRNFERPFFARSVNEFWRRWHITLGAWLRDYIFYSISLSKPFKNLSNKARQHMNEYFAKLIPAASALFFVWFANGFWHGASWKYIMYGMYYYLIMLLGMICEPLIERFCNRAQLNRDSKPYHLFQMLRTFVLVNIGMLMFRADTLPIAGKMFGSIFSGFSLSAFTNGSLLTFGMDRHDFLVIALGILVMLVVSILQEKGVSIREWIANRNIILRWAIYFGAIFAVIILGAYGSGYEPVDFIYAQF